MRLEISNPEWNKYFYHSSHFKDQIKMENEPLEQEKAKVLECLKKLHESGMIPSIQYDLEKFLEYRKKVHDNFFIYWTAINPPMEHLLFALSNILKPKRILGLGIFTGNPVAWSLGPALCGIYKAEYMVAVEINKDHAKKCQENFDKVSAPATVTVLGEDGFEVLKGIKEESIDLMYMDGNGRDPLSTSWFKKNKNTKRINYAFLKLGYTKIKSGGFSMCHNAYESSFKRDAGDYLKFTDDTNFFKMTSTIGIDEMGLEFSVKK
jgi:predicted O-methyltransferase YrrM